MEPIDETPLGLELFDTNVAGVRDERAREVSEGVADEIGLYRRSIRGRSIFGRRYAGFFAVACLCFCHIPVRFNSAVALALGCAPCASQWSARSSSSSI